MFRFFPLFLTCCVAACVCSINLATATQESLVRVVDLSVGEQTKVTLSNGAETWVKLIEVRELLDSVTGAVRRAIVTVDVNGERIELVSATYQLPRRIAGVQIDCPITKGYNKKGTAPSWGLDKDARLRLWPGNSPWIAPESFGYPAKQKWFATDTQMANEPVYVDGGEQPGKDSIYYHSGLDIGGTEGRVEIVAATDGLVVSSAGEVLPEHRHDTPVSPRYDVVYVLDQRGWYYRYSHLKGIDSDIKSGAAVKQGDRIGSLGKEGGSGGWTHLHFEIKSRQPSGKWGTQEGYAFLWQAYRSEHQPDLIAVARPHHLVWTEESLTLDATKSWSAAGEIVRYEWIFEDGSTARGARVQRIYSVPGRHSEVLKVTDAAGNTAFDFAVVIVYDKAHPERHINTIHPTCAPTFGIRPGDEVTFTVRSFIPNQSREGHEIWDFGDGQPPVRVQSDGNAVKHAPEGYAVTTHRYSKPGDYIVRVQRTHEFGVKATGHLWVHVEP